MHRKSSLFNKFCHYCQTKWLFAVKYHHNIRHLRQAFKISFNKSRLFFPYTIAPRSDVTISNSMCGGVQFPCLNIDHKHQNPHFLPYFVNECPSYRHQFSSLTNVTIISAQACSPRGKCQRNEQFSVRTVVFRFMVILCSRYLIMPLTASHLTSLHCMIS